MTVDYLYLIEKGTPTSLSFFSLFLNMVRTINVYKGSHPVQLTLDEQGLRIEGDLTAAKKCKKKKITLYSSYLTFSP